MTLSQLASRRALPSALLTSPCVSPRHARAVGASLPSCSSPLAAQRDRQTQRSVAVHCQASEAPISDQVCLVVGDIGGTNARLAIVSADLATGGREELFFKIFPTSDFAAFNTVLRSFLCEDKVKEQGTISAACLAVAGPVSQNACAMTNLSWTIDGAEIERDFGFRTEVLNDFAAVGYGIPVLDASEVVILNPSAVVDKGPIAVLGPGTGLGEAQLMWDTGLDRYCVWASEGSHAEFAPRGLLQRELLAFAEEENDLPCEIEHLACGSGLKRIYRFLCHKDGISAQDYTPSDISQKGLKAECSLCSQAVDLFLEVIGAEAGHMALRSLATGGVYIAGGIAPKLIDRIREGGVLSAFLNHRSRFTTVIQQFPLFVILNDGVGMKGTTEFAISLAKDLRK